jgi:F-type H+-transporting ATPase subunit epsilon
MLHLRVITPKKVVIDEEVNSVTAPGTDGEMTILPRHSNIFSQLKEGIVTIRRKNGEDSIAIGGGYLETDGRELTLLVSRAYGQDEIDDKLTEQAVKQAKEVLAKSKDAAEITEAQMLLRRSLVDLNLVKRKRRV